MRNKARLKRLETTQRSGGISWKDFVTGAASVKDSTWRAFLSAVEGEYPGVLHAVGDTRTTGKETGND